MENQTYKIKYISGPTTLNTKPGQFIFYDGNKAKVVLDAHKDNPEATLFDVNVSDIQVIVNPGLAGKSTELPQVLVNVNEKKYEFLSGDGSFMGNTNKLNDALKAAGAQFPNGFAGAKGVTPSKTNKFVVYFVYLVIVIIVAVFIYSLVKK